jgi:Zn-finger nucleic acid-binding protein
MQCPVCDERLREIEKYGVMVDICPSCKGVWLDRGELEKIVSLDDRGDHDERKRSGCPDSHAYGKPKRRSLLSDLLEGFGD